MPSRGRNVSLQSEWMMLRAQRLGALMHLALMLHWLHSHQPSLAWPLNRELKPSTRRVK